MGECQNLSDNRANQRIYGVLGSCDVGESATYVVYKEALHWKVTDALQEQVLINGP